MTGYDRDAFGQAWSDDTDDQWGHNGCDTRNDILRRDLTQTSVGNGCTVYSGVLDDPYTGRRISFTRGVGTSSAVQIDHVVALGDAWQTGGQQLGPAQRVDLANDPLNLIAVDGPTNQAKRDADAASWLPPNKAFRCAYVARQVAVKHEYRLWVTAAEQVAMERVLARCPTLPLPGEAAAQSPTWSDPSASSTATTSPSAPSSATPTAAAVYYTSCGAVRAAGAAPLYRGQPGYRSALDRDDDGIACET
jgi:hypothetical protein